MTYSDLFQKQITIEEPADIRVPPLLVRNCEWALGSMSDRLLIAYSQWRKALEAHLCNPYLPRKWILQQRIAYEQILVYNACTKPAFYSIESHNRPIILAVRQDYEMAAYLGIPDDDENSSGSIALYVEEVNAEELHLPDASQLVGHAARAFGVNIPPNGIWQN